MESCRVLLVDDEEEFVLALAKRLRTRGIVVDTAFRGEAALERVKEARYDVIVLDLMMPGMDGIETLTEVRKLDPDVRVILLTGHGTVQVGVEAMKLGATDLLEKPASFPDLLQKIQEAGAEHGVLVTQRNERSVEEILRKRGW